MMWLWRIFLGLVVVFVLLAVAGVGYYFYLVHAFNKTSGEEVREAGLVGHFYAAPGAKHRPAVLMLGGSNGGYPYDKAAADLAKSGYPVFAQAYFKNFLGQPSGVPGYLAEIPLENFDKAMAWMRSRPEIDPNKIVVMGESRGGELVLLLAARDPKIAGVIAFSPSHVVWGGLKAPYDMAAWTDGGKPLPFLSSTPPKGESFGPDTLMKAFNRALTETPAEQLEAASIKVENIHGPVLLISSRADRLWPSSHMADLAEARLKAHHFAYPVENLQFEDSSHLLMGYGPGIIKLGFPPRYGFYFGGSEEGTRRARDAGWAAAKAFLAKIDTGER